MKFAVLSSTGGSVVKKVFNNTTRFEFDLSLMISDRECGAVDFAKDNGIDVEYLAGESALEKSDSLNAILDQYKIDYLYLFYTRIIMGDVLEKYSGKIINFHPSLLPACPGLQGFEDTLESGALIAGSTVHFIDAGIDTGRQIIQTYTPTVGIDVKDLRHIIFLQQCASLYDTHRKICSNPEELLTKNKRHVAASGFCPKLENDSHLFYNRLINQ